MHFYSLSCTSSRDYFALYHLCLASAEIREWFLQSRISHKSHFDLSSTVSFLIKNHFGFYFMSPCRRTRKEHTISSLPICTYVTFQTTSFCGLQITTMVILKIALHWKGLLQLKRKFQDKNYFFSSFFV